jgi:transglutaminase-like putative cysteine protease
MTTMLLRIAHETHLTYSEPVTEAVIELRMAPASGEDQTVLGYQLRVSPAVPVTTYRDGFGNRVDLVSLLAPNREVTIRATSYVRPHRRPATERLGALALAEAREPHLESLEFLQPSPLVPRVAELDGLAAPLRSGGSLIAALTGAMEAVRSRLKYEKLVTTARTPVNEALELGRGVCQDFAQVMIGACRAGGLPARYVSGYIHQPDEIETHAWCQVWCGPAGWVDLDPTHGQFAGADHVVTAVGRDYGDVPPNRGVWKGAAGETMSVAVTVEAVDRMPPEEAGGGGTSWPTAAMAAVTRSQRGSGTAYRSQARLLYRHQQEQQQQ